MRILAAIFLTPLVCTLPTISMARPVPEDAGQPNLRILSVAIVDPDGEPISPQAGKPFWVRVDYVYENAVGSTHYTIERTVNSFTHTTARIDLGGPQGTSQWSHTLGSWLLHKRGSYEISARVDSEDTIFESAEDDNELTILVNVEGSVTPQWDLVKVDEGRQLLGDGTNVIVGTMDDAMDFRHPWLSGNDSLGRPRLVAANQNTAGFGGAPVNARHATAVMGVVLARGANAGDITGMVPDARYVTAEFLNRASIPEMEMPHVFDAAGFLVENGVEVINMSWAWFIDPIAAKIGEGATNLLVDYLAYGRNIVCVPAINQREDSLEPTAPASARNAISVGGLEANLIRAWGPQDHGPTRDGRSKPDILGNDAENTVSLRPGWADGRPARGELGGTSFAAPFVTGAVAQLLDYGKTQGENTDHRVLKAVVMNSGVKALDDDGSPWNNDSNQALDDQQGTGILNMVRAHAMYSAGRQAGPEVMPKGYDFRTVSGTTSEPYPGGRVIYRLGLLTGPQAQFDATLVWDRHTYWSDDNGNGRIDAADDFYTTPTDTQDNLDLVLYRNGVAIASSRSTVDNVEHVSVPDLQPGVYELHVERLDRPFSGDSEEYAIAWLGEGTWTQNFTRATYSTFGTGCPGSYGTPVLELVPGHEPWINGPLQVRVTNLSSELSFGSVTMLLGFSKTDYYGIPLPMDLDPFGIWWCTGYTSSEVFIPLLSFLGTATWEYDIPNNSEFVGLHFYNQALVWDPGYNPAGFIVSNAGEGVIGGR